MCYYFKRWQISLHCHRSIPPRFIPSLHPAAGPASPLSVSGVVMPFWSLLISQLRPCHPGDPWTNHQEGKRGKRRGGRSSSGRLNGWLEKQTRKEGWGGYKVEEGKDLKSEGRVGGFRMRAASPVQAGISPPEFSLIFVYKKKEKRNWIILQLCIFLNEFLDILVEIISKTESSAWVFPETAV